MDVLYFILLHIDGNVDKFQPSIFFRSWENHVSHKTFRTCMLARATWACTVCMISSFCAEVREASWLESIFMSDKLLWKVYQNSSLIRNKIGNKRQKNVSFFLSHNYLSETHKQRELVKELSRWSGSSVKINLVKNFRQLYILLKINFLVCTRNGPWNIQSEFRKGPGNGNIHKKSVDNRHISYI